MAINLTEHECEIVKKIFEHFLTEFKIDATKIYVFGSRARGACKPFSDLDLAIDLGRKISEAFKNSIESELVLFFEKKN
jgi:predicted nucleotidyltransferase